MDIYAEVDMKSIGNGFGGLDNLLIPANDVELNDLLGEGTVNSHFQQNNIMYHKIHCMCFVYYVSIYN